MSTNTTTTSSVNEDLPKAVITLGVLGGALVIGLIIAKLADYFYERSSVRDDASDISEHTKELLKTQLELMRMGKNRDRDKFDKNKTESSEDQTTKAMTLWSNKVKAKGKLNTIPEAGEAAASSGAATPQPEAKGKQANLAQAEGKKPQETTKVWSEAEKKPPAKGTTKSPPKKEEKVAPSTSKASPSKTNAAAENDDEFQVPSDIAAPGKGGRAAAKNSTILVPANLSKDVNIRPITPATAGENVPNSMRPKTPFSQRSFSRYNAVSDTAKPTTSRPTTAKKSKS